MAIQKSFLVFDLSLKRAIRNNENKEKDYN